MPGGDRIRVFLILLAAQLFGCSAPKSWCVPNPAFVPYSSQYNSIDELTKESKRKMKEMEHKGYALFLLNEALDNMKPKEAYQTIPEEWSKIDKYLDSAKQDSGYNPDADAGELIRRVYSEYVRVEGQKKVDESLYLTKKLAETGTLRMMIDKSLEKIKKEAAETGAYIDPQFIECIMYVYSVNIKRVGTRKAEELRGLAADLFRQGSTKRAKLQFELAAQYDEEVKEASRKTQP